LLILLWAPALSQDANYWNGSYGPGSFITPGATIARNMDSGVLFYNPALLAYNRKSAATISGNIYNYQSIKIKNGAGTGLDLKSSLGSIIPVIASNTIYLNLKGKPITIAYALLNNPVMGFQTSQRKDDRQNVLDDSYSPGPEIFIGQYTLANSVTETSGILAFGKPVSSRLAVGFSFTAQLRKQSTLIDNRSRVLINDTSSFEQKLVTTSEYYLANNFNIGLGIKGGISYDIAPHHHLGILLSAPLIHLHGTADVLSEDIVSNLRLSSNSTDEFHLLANAKQTGLRSRWKMPLSGALGYTYDYGKGQLYFAAEYFNKVKEYNVITPRKDYFIRPDTSSQLYTTNFIRLKDARKAILNFSAAISFPLKDAVTGYCSFRTDFNYSGDKLYKDDDGYKVNVASWNLYHLDLGGNFRKRKFNLRAGLLFTYGITNKYLQPVNYDNPHESNFLDGDTGLTRARRWSAGLMFSYIHNL
jgi:hypothetical protein